MGKHGENIRKRKDGRWEARLISEYDGTGKAKYRSFYGKTYMEAKEKRNAYLRSGAEAQYQQKVNSMDKRKILVSQIMMEWLDSRRDSVKESTYAHYKNLAETHILPKLGRIPLGSLTPENINQFLKVLLSSGRIDGKGGLSPKTVADIRSVLLLALEYARSSQYPCPDLGKIFSPHVTRPEMKVLTLEQQEKLENYLFQHPGPMELGILITLYGGLRIGELCALQWRDIHFESGTLQVSKTILRIQKEDRDKGKKTQVLISRPKTDSSNRLIPLPGFLLEFLKNFRQESESYLITGTKFYLEPRMCLEKYKKILKKAGLESYTFHTLRHTFATRCVEKGFDPKSLSEILGHANINTTLQNYVHPSIDLKKEQMDRLEQVSVWGQNKGQNKEKKSGTA